jgi:hypothetical protein
MRMRLWSSPAALSSSSISIVIRETTTRSTAAQVCVGGDSAQARGWKIGGRARSRLAEHCAIRSSPTILGR